MFTLPTPPTDNLYKFISIFGLIISIASFIYVETKSIEIANETYNANKLKFETQVEKQKIESFRNEIEKNILDYYSVANIKAKPIINDSIIVWTKTLTGDENLVSQSSNISKQFVEYELKKAEFAKKENEYDTIEKVNELNISEQEKLFEWLDILLPIGILLTFVGFLLWYFKSQKLQDYILQEQYMALKKTTFCQSCGIKLERDAKYITLTEDQKKTTEYCSACYIDGEFVEPNLTLEQMKTKISKRAKELGYSKLAIYFYLKQINELGRWRTKFTWK